MEVAIAKGEAKAWGGDWGVNTVVLGVRRGQSSFRRGQGFKASTRLSFCLLSPHTASLGNLLSAEQQKGPVQGIEAVCEGCWCCRWWQGC